MNTTLNNADERLFHAAIAVRWGSWEYGFAGVSMRNKLGLVAVDRLAFGRSCFGLSGVFRRVSVHGLIILHKMVARAYMMHTIGIPMAVYVGIEAAKARLAFEIVKRSILDFRNRNKLMFKQDNKEERSIYRKNGTFNPRDDISNRVFIQNDIGAKILQLDKDSFNKVIRRDSMVKGKMFRKGLSTTIYYQDQPTTHNYPKTRKKASVTLSAPEYPCSSQSAATGQQTTEIHLDCSFVDQEPLAISHDKEG